MAGCGSRLGGALCTAIAAGPIGLAAMGLLLHEHHLVLVEAQAGEVAVVRPIEENSRRYIPHPHPQRCASHRGLVRRPRKGLQQPLEDAQ